MKAATNSTPAHTSKVTQPITTLGHTNYLDHPSPSTVSSTTSSRTRTSPPASLLTLLVELRNRIYAFALSRVIKLNSNSIHTPRGTRSLPLVCRRLHPEPLKLYYASSTFEIPSLPALERWLITIGPELAAEVKAIGLWHDVPRGDQSALAYHFAPDVMILCKNLLASGFVVGVVTSVKVRIARKRGEWISIWDVWGMRAAL